MSKINCWVGIDPGVKGAVAVLRPDGLALHRFPLTKGKADYGKQALMLNSEIFRKDDVPFIAIEHTQGVGMHGASSNHSLGWSNGFLLFWVLSQKQPYELVKPQEWQKIVWSPSDYVYKTPSTKKKDDTTEAQSDKPKKPAAKRKDPKPTSKKAAFRLFPNETFIPKGTSTTEHDGFIDAALLAYYAKRVSL